MAEVIFKDNHIQTGHRIKIPKAIVDTLDLKVKQKIKIRFDVHKKNIIIEIDDEQEEIDVREKNSVGVRNIRKMKRIRRR